MTRRQAALALVVIVVFTCARIAATYRVFSQTSDENIHLAAGYDVVKKHTWMTDVHHPPLARVFFALPFAGLPESELPWERTARGNALLVRGDRYEHNLVLMRIGNLMFVIIGVLAVGRWATRLWSREAGVLAAALFAMVPAILAHGGLATTDMSVAAMLPLALDECSRLIETPNWRRALTSGLAVAGGVLSKFSFLPYFPAAMGAIVLVYALQEWRLFVRWQFYAWTIAAALLCVAIVWAGFGFSWQPLIAGISEVRLQNTGGHRAFLFGEMRWHGWWYYFPIALFFKTPIPFLILAIGGCVLTARKRPEIALVAAVILGVAMTSRINIGVRHLLPIYAPMAIAAAILVASMWQRAPALLPSTRGALMPAVTLVLVAWLAAGSLAAHPDYLPWFNAFAGKHPENILNDSNLDWGQDLLRLARYSRREHIDHISLLLFTNADLSGMHFPPHEEIKVVKAIHGPFAISEMEVAIGMTHSEKVTTWLKKLIGGKPYKRIGKSIRLYDL